MSLLLEALKKSGDKQHGTGLSALTLEDAPPPRGASATSESASASRSAGENLFAAKKKKKGSTMRWNLGLVPTTLLFAVVFGSGYGYYVWLEIQPPKQQRVAQRKPAPPAPAPVPVAKAPTLVPLVPAMPRETTAPSTEKQPPIAARNNDFDTPRSKPRARPSRNRYDAPDVAFQRNVQPDATTPALLDAWQAYQRGDYVTAEQGYRQALARDANNRDALLGLAATAQQQGREEAAQQYYRQMLVLDPRDASAQAALAAYSSGDTANTESRIKQLLAGQPRSAELHFALGNLYAGQSDWGDAQQYYFNAYTLEPSNAQFAFNLAVSLEHLGQQKLASQHYQQALQLDVSGNSGFDRAQAQQRLNELTRAK